MGNFEDELAQAQVEVRRVSEQACEGEETQKRVKARFESLFDSTIREHLPQLMRETKPYAEGLQKVWVILDGVLGVIAGGSLVKPVIRRNDDLQLGVSRSTVLDTSEYQGRVTTVPFHHSRSGLLDDEYDGWGLFEDEIWYGTTNTKTKLVTYIARAIVRG